jgi:O-antigen ligase
MITLFVWNPVRGQGPKRAPVSLLKRLVWIVIAVAVIVVAWSQLPSSARDRFATMLDIESDYNFQEEDVGRTFIWRRNMGALMGRPIGFGVDSSIALDGVLGGKYRTSHNSLVQVATELGFVGLILFLRLYWLAWRNVSRVRYLPVASEREPRAIAGHDVPLLLHGLRSALVASFVAGFFLSQAYSYLLFTLFAVAAALVALQPTQADDRAALARQNNARVRPALHAGKH